MKPEIDVIKIGGNVIDDEQTLQQFIQSLSLRTKPFVLVHGGGKLATALSKTLNISTEMIEGRRVTNQQTLDVVVMVYAGLINKNIVALLQSNNKNAIGLSGADGNVICAKKRAPINGVDYGFVGDIDITSVNTEVLAMLLNNGLTPVLSAITHNNNGQLLNTNADTIASVVASALTQKFDVNLFYCFEKDGVLDENNEVIKTLSLYQYNNLKSQGTIHSGMIPKMDNAFNALNHQVKQVFIIHSNQINNPLNGTTLAQ
jgi:acetylglutamate kinase